MRLARVEGNVVATRKHSSLEGWRLVVCQPINLEGEDDGVPATALREIAILRELKHPNIVRFYDYWDIVRATAAKGANLVPMAQKWLKNPSSIK